MRNYIYNRQPPGPAIVNRNTVFRNVSFLWSGSSPWRDLAGNHNESYGGANNTLNRRPSPVTSDRGRIMDATASGTIEHIMFGPVGATAQTSSNRIRYAYGAGWTLGLIFRRNSGSFSGSNGINVTSANFWGNNIRLNSSNNVTAGSSNVGTITSDSTYTAGTWIAAMFVLQTGTNNTKLFVNGVEQTSKLSPSSLSDIGQDRISLEASGVDLLAAFASKDILGQRAATAWYENPWQLFSIQRKINLASYLPLPDSNNNNFFLMF